VGQNAAEELRNRDAPAAEAHADWA
jgi:hypothetical protein